MSGLSGPSPRQNGRRGLNPTNVIRGGLKKTLPAILITADRTQETTSAALSAGCVVLHKPVRPAELRALMQHLVSAV